MACKQVVMIGPSIDSPGGMSSVVFAYRNAGLFDRWGVRYVASFRWPSWRSKLWQLAVSVTTLVTMLLRRKVALVHVHTASRGSFWRKLIFVGLARVWGVPVVLHVHGGEFLSFYHDECGSTGRASIRWAMRTSAVVLCLTESWRVSFATIEPRANCMVLVNPVDAEPAVLQRRMTGSVMSGQVLFLGRLEIEKGVFDLLGAWPKVLARVPHARLVLAGGGDQESILDEARRLGITASITLPGWVEKSVKQDWLASSDIFTLPSHAEGLPVCILEAMMCAMPVVATRVGGIPDVLSDGVDALLVSPADVPALADALIAALTEEALRTRMTAAALMHVRQIFETSGVVRQLETVYRKVLHAEPDDDAPHVFGQAIEP